MIQTTGVWKQAYLLFYLEIRTMSEEVGNSDIPHNNLSFKVLFIHGKHCRKQIGNHQLGLGFLTRLGELLWDARLNLGFLWASLKSLCNFIWSRCIFFSEMFHSLDLQFKKLMMQKCKEMVLTSRSTWHKETNVMFLSKSYRLVT